MKTFGEYVTLVPKSASRSAAARSISSGRGWVRTVASSTDSASRALLVVPSWWIVDFVPVSRLMVGCSLRLYRCDETPERGSAALTSIDQNNWYSLPNTSLTDPPRKTWLIESARTPAQDSTRTLAGAWGDSAIVSVTTICSNGDAARLS